MAGSGQERGGGMTGRWRDLPATVWSAVQSSGQRDELGAQAARPALPTPSPPRRTGSPRAVCSAFGLIGAENARPFRSANRAPLFLETPFLSLPAGDRPVLPDRLEPSVVTDTGVPQARPLGRSGEACLGLSGDLATGRGTGSSSPDQRVHGPTSSVVHALVIHLVYGVGYTGVKDW